MRFGWLKYLFMYVCFFVLTLFVLVANLNFRLTESVVSEDQAVIFWRNTFELAFYLSLFCVFLSCWLFKHYTLSLVQKIGVVLLLLVLVGVMTAIF